MADQLYDGLASLPALPLTPGVSVIADQLLLLLELAGFVLLGPCCDAKPELDERVPRDEPGAMEGLP